MPCLYLTPKTEVGIENNSSAMSFEHRHAPPRFFSAVWVGHPSELDKVVKHSIAPVDKFQEMPSLYLTPKTGVVTENNSNAMGFEYRHAPPRFL